MNTHTGAQRIWRGGSLAGGYNFFRVASLSWTGGHRELAVLGQWCRAADLNPGGEECPRWERQAQLRAINPAGPAAAPCWAAGCCCGRHRGHSSRRH